jgi:hypothetical protein
MRLRVRLANGRSATVHRLVCAGAWWCWFCFWWSHRALAPHLAAGDEQGPLGGRLLEATVTARPLVRCHEDRRPGELATRMSLDVGRLDAPAGARVRHRSRRVIAGLVRVG